MDLSQIKMVVSDMDGTLLNSNHEVSPKFYKLFQKLKEKNIQFVAASGRQYLSMVDKLNTIKDDIIFIAENGAIAKERDTELLVNPLPETLVQDVLERVGNMPDAYPLVCGKYTSYCDGSSPQFNDMIKEYYAALEIVPSYQTVKDEILKIAIYHPVSTETYIYPRLQSLEQQLKVKVSGQNWIDLNNTTADKGNALRVVMKKLDIKPNELLVFGDYNNDIEMLELAGFSFAMANAHPNVKKIAKYQTTSNDDFGVEKIIEKLLD